MTKMMMTDELQEFLNDRVPHAKRNPLSTDIKVEERSIVDSNAGGTTTEDHCNLSTGMALLQHFLCHDNNTSTSGDESLHCMSDASKIILRQLLQSHGMDFTSPPTAAAAAAAALPGNVKDSKKEQRPRKEQPSRSKSRLFPLILETVTKLQQSHNLGEETSTSPPVSSSSSSEIIQAIALDLTAKIEPKGVLRAEDLPATVESNHAIYAALLFLSQPLAVHADAACACSASASASASASPLDKNSPLLLDSSTSTRTLEEAQTYTTIFPSMPLLNAERTDKDHHPKTFHLHPTNVSTQKLHDVGFLAKLETLEDAFWGSSSVSCQSRCHIVPRFDFDSHAKEERFIRTGETIREGGKGTTHKKNNDGAAAGKKRKSCK